MSLQSLVFSSRTVLSDLSSLLDPSEGATLADGDATPASQRSAADHHVKLTGESSSVPDVSHIWSLLFAKTEPSPALPLALSPVVPGKLTHFKASHFELIPGGDLTASPKIGEGACYLVEKRRLSAIHGGKVIALKTPKLRPSTQSKHVASTVLRELKILTHPPLQANHNIASIIGYCPSQASDYSSLGLSLVTELANHGTLSDYLARPLVEGRSPHALTTKLGLLHDVASGLEALHACGLVQGDVKTENVLVFDSRHDKYGEVTAKLSDFGHAIPFHKDKPDEKKLYLGTLVLNAPEARHKNAVAAQNLWRCDVFSYGLVVWETIIDGARYLSTVGESGIQYGGVMDWLESLPQDEMLRFAIAAANQSYGSSAPPLLNTIQRVLKASLRDDSSARREMKEITGILRQQNFLAATARARSADKAIPPQPLSLTEGGVANDMVRKDGLDMVPMAFRDSILQHLETTSHSADASTPMRRAAHLDLAFALLSNFTGKADPPRAMKHLRDGAAMGSSMALAMYCRLHNVFDVESSPSVMELAPPLSDLRIELLALPEDSPLSTWLRVLEAWNQRQAMQTKMRVTLGDRVLVYGGSMEAIEMCLENSGPLDVEALKATVVDSIDAEMNPCFESPLLLDIACRLGNLDLVQQLLTMHLPQDRQERSRHLVGDCLVQACRGGKIHVVEHLVRHVAEPYLMWPKSSTGLHWLFMFQPEDQQKALDLLTNTSHYWHTSLLTRAPEPGVHVGLATLTGSPIEFATAVRATSTVDVLVAKITELQGKGLLGQVTQDQFRQAITRHVASAVGVLLPLELRRRRGHNVESALARLRLSQGKTEFQPFGIFDVGRSASSLSLALLHGSAEAMSRAIDDTIDVILTSRIADINDADDDTLSETPLVEAVRWAPCSYDTAILSSLISRGAHLGDTPAPVVLKRLIAPRPAGTKRVVTQILVEAGLLEIDAVLIIQAIETADAEIVGALLDYCPGSFSLSQPLKRYGHATSITLLQAAVLFPGGADLVLFLIDKGADIDEAGEGTSPLEISMMKPSDADVIDLLIERGASLKATNYPTVIHLAASLDVFVNGSHVLSHLLRHERVRARLADEQAQTNENILSPIHAACFSANVEAIAAMLEVGVELPRGDGELDILAQSILLGRRPKLNQLLHVSEEDDDAVFRWKTKSERLILYLLDRLESNHGRTPLHVACQIGNLRRVQALVEEDFASLFATDSHGRLPIDFLEDPNLLEEQRFQREDISERTVSNAQRLWDYIEMKVAEKLSSAAADLMAQDLDGATLNNFSLSPRQTPVSCALNRDSSASAGSAELTTDSQFGLKPERMGHGDISKALAEISAEYYGEGRAVSCRNGSSTDFLDGNKAPEEVLPIVRDLFERKSQQLGELHQETLDVNETLLELLGILNQQEEASEMVAPLLRRRRAVHQQDDARIFGVWRDSLIVLLNEGRELEAEEELRKAMEAAKNLVGVSHVSYLMFVPVLATIECSRGNHSECLSTNERLLETLETVEQQTQRGTSLRSEILVHLCYHRLGEGNTDAVRKHMNAALKCLTSIEPRHFLVEFDVLRSLATTIEQVDVVLSHMMWTELLSICGSRCEPGGYCVIESRRHLAKNLMNRGMFEDAYDQYHRVTQATVICKGHDVEEALLASIDEARALHKRNLNPAALSLLRPVLEKFERRQGGHEEDLHTLEAKALLAQLLLAQDNLDDWEVVAREVAGGYAQRQPSSDVAVDSKRTLAETLSRMGRSSEASQIAQECLEITTEVHQECHPRTMAIATEAQLYLARCAQWVASVSMCERGLAIAKALHGESSQEVADWLHLLGTSMGLADMDGGLELLLQSIDLTVQLDGGTHSRSSLTSMWSAGVHMRKQSPEKALKMFCEILESCNSLEDEPQSLKIRVRTDIGRCYTDLEQYADALPHLEQSVRESRQLWGDSTKETISVIDSLIDVLLPLGRAKEALPLAHEVLDFFESTSASSEDELIEAKGRLADVYYNLDKCSSAERLWEQALKGLAELGDEADQDKVADYRHNRARALVGILDFEAAADLSYLSFDHYRHAKGNEAKETLLVSITRAYIDSLLGKHAAAETTLLGVIESSKRSQALDYLVGQAEAKLGGLYIKMGKHQNAEEVLLRAVQRVERDFTAHHFLYRAYKEQLKYEEAEEQAAVLLSMVSEDVDEEAIDAELQLFQLYVAMDDLDKAQIWANSLFGRLKNLTDYQGNPLDVALGLQDLIEFFERTKDEQRLFEASVVLEHVRENLPLSLKTNLLWRSMESKKEQS